jgi:hypothetical protein
MMPQKQLPYFQAAEKAFWFLFQIQYRKNRQLLTYQYKSVAISFSKFFFAKLA